MPTWIIYALLSMFFAGLTSVLAKSGLKDLNADFGLALRTTVVFILVLANFFTWHNLKDMPQVSQKAAFFLILSGITTSLSWIFYYRAIKIGDVSMVATIDKGSLVITLILSFLILKEPITPKVIIGGLLMLAGTFVLVWK